MAWTTINKSTDYFFTKLWTGTNAGETISGIPFQPDFNWTKQRTGTRNHALVDAVRGVEKTLSNLKNEIERDMKLMGVNNISELSRKNLRFRE